MVYPGRRGRITPKRPCRAHDPQPRQVGEGADKFAPPPPDEPRPVELFLLKPNDQAHPRRPPVDSLPRKAVMRPPSGAATGSAFLSIATWTFQTASRTIPQPSPFPLR